MRKHTDSHSGFFNPRLFTALLLFLTGASLGILSLGAAPSLTITNASSSSADAPATPTTPGMPRYYNYAPPAGMGESSGEPSIGFNPSSGRVMYLSNLQTLQATLPEDITPLGSVPDACNASWADVSYTTTRVRSVDPILFTDQGTGRTFVSQLNTVTQSNPVLVGLNSLMAYTDDDGATWTPAQVNPPDGSNDHETVGAGPYPATLSNLSNDLNKGHAVYYCGQGGYVLAITSIAYCSRSDDGGLNFGKAVPAYTDAASGCSQAIHGHVKVAPDGTVYLPNAQCGGGQAVAASTDAGTTWAVRTVPGSLSPTPPTPASSPPAIGDIADPSVGVSKDPPVAPATSNTMYFAWTGRDPAGNSVDNHAFVAVTKDRGLTWTQPYDIGAQLGIKNALFVSAVAGDSNRAAVAFLGTTTTGDHQAPTFTGTWYGFVAHTYDGGQTWTTVNATPAGPVQRNACIWTSGGNNTCRNLLDFTDATMDDTGRVLFAFADGCVDACETGGPNSYSSKATIARQSGGKGLLAQFDPVEPALARRACLSGCRDDRAAYLNWIAPDNGGSDVTGYKIYRSDATHPETLIGQQTNPADNTFSDRSVDPTVTTYSYRITAVNGQGEGPASNSVSLPLGVCLASAGPCLAPGVTVIVDPAGDETDTLAQHDITSVSVSEPITNATTGAASNVVITMKVANLSTIPEGFRWSIRFGVIKHGTLVTAPSSGIPGDTSVTDYFVAMASDGMGPGGGPSFNWGVTSTPNGAARVFTNKGTIDPSSNATADGTITLVLPKSIIHDPDPGDSIALTLASVRGALPSGTNETIFDQTGAGSYVFRANNLCLPNTPPLAVLNGNVDQGTPPLQVNFDASASHDPDGIDTIASYTFNFGDGGDDVTQAAPTISHTFTDPGEYVVRLIVTDSRGKQSSNTATFLVEVNGALTRVVSRKTHGTLTPVADLPLNLGTPATIEPRSGGIPSGNHTLVFSFFNTLNGVSSITATATTSGGTQNVTATGSIASNAHDYIVSLTGVPNASHLNVTLNGVTDSARSLGNISAHMDVLLGDVSLSGRTDAGDVTQVRNRTVTIPDTTDPASFRYDVNASGRIDAGDVTATRNATVTVLPP